jgi:hypothetical protein
MKTAAMAPEEQHFILSNLPPGPVQKRLALCVALALLVAFVITAGPLSTIQLGRIDAFVPAYATAMLVNDSITAILLFAQFSILRSRALLVIASGYLFTALILIPFSASSRLIGLNGETNSLKKKKSSATIVADVTAAAQRSNWV